MPVAVEHAAGVVTVLQDEEFGELKVAGHEWLRRCEAFVGQEVAALSLRGQFDEALRSSTTFALPQSVCSKCLLNTTQA